MNPINIVQEDKICVICYDQIQAQPEEEEMKEMALKCDHYFHSCCIGEWLKQKHTCPICRIEIQVSKPEVSFISEMTQNEILAIPDNQPRVVVGNRENNLRSLQEAVNEAVARNMVNHYQFFGEHAQPPIVAGGFTLSSLGLNPNNFNVSQVGVSSVRRF